MLTRMHHLLALAGLAAICAPSHAQVFCRTVTWFNPTGASNAPFSNVAAAAQCATPLGGSLTINAGSYPEPMTLTRPMTITAANGPAQVGKFGSGHTSLKVFSFNTHLFGTFPLPVWQDQDRAQALGNYLEQKRLEGVDVIALEEVWSSSRWDDIQTRANFPYYGYGSRRDSGSTQNSGLAILSTPPVTNFAQISYNDENGIDASASKGYIQQTISKNGYQVGVFITHTQSGNSSGDITTRASQFAQLATAISIYRAFNPSHAIIVMGDMNASATSNEYLATMSNAFGGTGATADIAPNLACLGDGPLTCTTCDNNLIRQAFNGSGNYRIDYILYGNSADTHLRVVPKDYQVLRPTSPTLISGSGYDPNQSGGVTFTLSTHTLSDHEAVYAEFDLVHD